MKQLVKAIALCLFIVPVATPAQTLAAECTVTSSANSGAGSLREKLSLTNDCTEIHFAEGVADIVIQSTLYLQKSNVNIYGPVNITAGGSFSASSPLMYVSNNMNTIDHVSFARQGGLCLKIKGYGSHINFNTFLNCGTGIQVYKGKNNTLLQNVFKNITSEEIELADGGNNDIPSASNIDAVMDSTFSFVLTGEVVDNAKDVQIYKRVENEDGSKDGLADAFLNVFYSDIDGTPLMFDWLTADSPLDMFAFLVTDTNGNTSAFSEAVVPMTLPSFFAEYPACGEAEWFTDPYEGYWPGDYDGDGKENGLEDVDKDCIIENGETDPAVPDSDWDGLINSADNCPYISNMDQTDTDGEGLGDICDEDDDGDGVADSVDNCPFIVNPDQTDSDNNGLGAACDASESVSTLPSETPPPDFLEGEEEPEDEDEAGGDTGGCSLIR